MSSVSVFLLTDDEAQKSLPVRGNGGDWRGGVEHMPTYTCGAPTKSGLPCKRKVGGPHERCSLHKTVKADKMVKKAKAAEATIPREPRCLDIQSFLKITSAKELHSMCAEFSKDTPEAYWDEKKKRFCCRARKELRSPEERKMRQLRDELEVAQTILAQEEQLDSVRRLLRHPRLDPLPDEDLSTWKGWSKSWLEWSKSMVRKALRITWEILAVLGSMTKDMVHWIANSPLKGHFLCIVILHLLRPLLATVGETMVLPSVKVMDHAIDAFKKVVEKTDVNLVATEYLYAEGTVHVINAEGRKKLIEAVAPGIGAAVRSLVGAVFAMYTGGGVAAGAAGAAANMLRLQDLRG